MSMTYHASRIPFSVLVGVIVIAGHSFGNIPFSFSTKEPGSSDIFIHFYTRSLIEWC